MRLGRLAAVLLRFGCASGGLCGAVKGVGLGLFRGCPGRFCVLLGLGGGQGVLLGALLGGQGGFLRRFRARFGVFRLGLRGLCVGFTNLGRVPRRLRGGPGFLSRCGVCRGLGTQGLHLIADLLSPLFCRLGFGLAESSGVLGLLRLSGLLQSRLLRGLGVLLRGSGPFRCVNGEVRVPLRRSLRGFGVGFRLGGFPGGVQGFGRLLPGGVRLVLGFFRGGLGGVLGRGGKLHGAGGLLIHGGKGVVDGTPHLLTVDRLQNLLQKTADVGQIGPPPNLPASSRWPKFPPPSGSPPLRCTWRSSAPPHGSSR